LNADDFFRALQYQDAMNDQKKKEADLKLHKEIYDYQQKALPVLQSMHDSDTPVDKLSKKDLSHLVRFGSRLFDAKLAFSGMLNKKIEEIREHYTEKLQALVEDESLRIEKPPETIPLPDVPTLDETLLEKERQLNMQMALSLVASARPGDLAFLEAISNAANAKRQEFEGAEEAKEEQKTERE